MLLSGMPYCAFHFSALAGVPVTMPASRQCFVFCSAGAIWFVLRLPSPTSAKPSFRSWRLVVGVARCAIDGMSGRASGHAGRGDRRHPQEVAATGGFHAIHPMCVV